MPLPVPDALLQFLRRTILGPRKFIYIAIAIVMIVGGRIINSWLTSPETAQSIQDALLALAGLNPLNMAASFFDRYFACDHLNLGGEVIANCSAWRFADPRRLIFGATGMFYDVWMEGEALTRLMLLLSVGASLPVARWTVMRAGEKLMGEPVEMGLFPIVVIAGLVPFLASVVGLAMQAVAWFLVFLLGYVVGIIAFLLLNFGWLVGLLSDARKVRETAREIERLHTKINPGGSSEDKPQP